MIRYISYSILLTAPGGQVNSNAYVNANLDYSPYNVGTVNENILNVRSEHSLNSNVIGEVYDGQLLQILGTDCNWYKINYNSGTCYVYASYVNDSGPVHPDNITINNPTPSHELKLVINPGKQYPRIGGGTIDFKG